MLNTNNKWVKFFIQSIVQDSQKKGYEKIRFPAGETAAKVEGHDTLADILHKKKRKLDNVEKALPKRLGELEEVKRQGHNPVRVEYLESKIDRLKDEQKILRQELKDNSLSKLAPIENFYQVRVKNTLMKEYGKNNIRTVKDEHGNTWFELTLDAKRDSNSIMMQKKTDGKIKGQADIDAKTVLINSLLQSQDTLPHEYAHHYIAMFRDTDIVQEAIRKWGSEEKLVQAIGEQVVKQKGEVYGWWKEFTQWIKDKFNKLDNKTKEELRNLLADSFLENKKLSIKESAAIIDKLKDSGINPRMVDSVNNALANAKCKI